MPLLPNYTARASSRIFTDTWLGLDKRQVVPESAFRDMTNLGSDEYPVLTQRPERGEITTPSGMAQGIITKDALCGVWGNTFYINGAASQLNGLSVPTIHTSTPGSPTDGDYLYENGITKKYNGTAWLEDAFPQKQLVSMGAFVCIFPDKKYINMADPTDKGSMDASFETTGNIEYTLVQATGDSYSPTPVTVKPENPANGDYWLDSSGEVTVLRRWSAYTSVWTEIPTTYVKLASNAIGQSFAENDGVTLSGCSGTSEVESLNGSNVIKACGENWIVVTGILSDTYTQETGKVKAERKVPDMDYVCEAGNRLWGCKYGERDGSIINELYCSALGDFKNWNRFSGISTDSWAASVGSDGVWTGCINYLGRPTFFKEDRIYEITISSSGAHRVDEYTYRGVQEHSYRSLAVVGETLYYKSNLGIMAYQGGMPIEISSELGTDVYEEASGGAWANKYYVSMRNGSKWSTFVYDTDKSMWHREDDAQFTTFSPIDADLYAVKVGMGDSAIKYGVWSLRGTAGTKETDIPWEAVSGIKTFDSPDHKYTIRYDFRVQMSAGSAVSVYMQYDSDGVWRKQGTMVSHEDMLGTKVIPVRPRRCDHLQIKLEGRGRVRVFSMARILQGGSDVR